MGIRIIMTAVAIVLASSQLCLGSTPQMLSHAIIDDSEEAVAARVISITQRLRSADRRRCVMEATLTATASSESSIIA